MNWKSEKKIEGLQVSGNYTYHLDFSVKGTSPYQSCIFSINAFTRPDRKIALAMKYKWYRVRGVRSYHLMGLNSNTYQFSAQDIGSVIQVEIIPQEDEYLQSKVTARIGPIRMDPSIRSTLEGILSAGGSKFPINLIVDETKYNFEQKDSGSLSLTSDFIKITSNMDSMRDRSIKFKYSLESPQLEMNHLDSTIMSFVFRGEEEEYNDVVDFLGLGNRKTKEKGCRIAFKLVSKNSRDLVVLALKCFAARNYLQMAKVINNIDTIFAEGKTFSDKAGDKSLFSGDLLLEIESIKKELYAVMDQNKDLVQEKESYIGEVRRLEEEILETIETYTKLIEELRTSAGHSSNMTLKENESICDMSIIVKKEDFESRKKLKELQIRNKELEVQVERMTEELEIVKNFNKSDGFFSESRIWVRSDEMNSFLKIDSKNEKSKKGGARNEDLERIAELEKVKEEHIKHIHILENKLVESQKTLERFFKNDSSFSNSSSNPNLKALETRLIETKRLNEMLIEENKSLKKEGEIMRNELEKLKQNHGVNESLQQINRLNDEIYSDNIKMLETMLSESKKHGEDQREICKRLEKEKHALLQEIGEYKMNITGLENELQHFRLLKGSGLYQSMYASPGKDYAGTPNKDFMSPLSTSRILDKEERFKRTEKDKNYLAEEVSRLKSQLTQTEIELSKSRMQTEKAESDYRNTKVKLENIELEMQFLKRENENYKSLSGGHFSGNILTSTYSEVQSNNIELKNLQTRYEIIRGELEKTKSELLSANTELERYKLRASSSTFSTVSSPAQPAWNNTGDLELKNYELRSDNEKLRMENDRLRGELDNRAGPAAPQDSFRNTGSSSGLDAKTIASIQQVKLENESLRKEVEKLRKQSANNDFNSSFVLNRTMHFEMESENETLRSTVRTMEQALTDYKLKFEIAQKENNQLKAIKPMMSSVNVLGGMTNNGEEQMIIRQLETRLAEARRTNENLVMEIADLKNKNESLRRDLETLRMTAGPAHDPNRSYQGSSFFANRTSALELESENEALRKNIASFELMLSDYKKRIELQQSEISVLSKKAASESRALQLEFEKADLITRIEYLKKENDRLSKENESLKAAKLSNSLFHDPMNMSFKDNREIESLKNENEMLVQQRNQISRRAESLAKELETLRNKPLLPSSSGGNQAMLDNLLQTNQRLMQENAKLMEQIRKVNDEMDGVRSHASRMMDLSMSRMEPEQEVQLLKDRIRSLQKENEAISTEKDKLLVELSKIMAQDHY